MQEIIVIFLLQLENFIHYMIMFLIAFPFVNVSVKVPAETEPQLVSSHLDPNSAGAMVTC